MSDNREEPFTTASLAALERMHSIALAIQQALVQNEFAALGSLAEELPQLLELCKRQPLEPVTPHALRLIAETCYLLDNSAEQLEKEMMKAKDRLRRLRRGRRIAAVVRTRRSAFPSKGNFGRDI